MAPGVKVLGRGAVGAGGRRLGDGKVLREPPRRQPLGGARQQRQQRAAAGIWCARAARKPGRRTGAAQRGLERRRVHVRGAHQDRHPVQRDAAGRFLQNGAGDLHALASLPGRGEEHDIAIGGGRGRPRWRRVGREQITAHARQGAGAVRLRRTLQADARQLRQRLERAPVTRRHGGEQPRGARRQRFHQCARGVVGNRDVEQQDRTGRQRFPACRGRRGRPQQPGPVDEPRLGKLAVVAPGQHRKVGGGRAEAGQASEIDSGMPQLIQRGRQRPREARHTRDRGQTPERSRLALLERDARRHRLHVEPGRRRAATARQRGGGELCRQLPQAAAAEAEAGALAGRQPSDEIVRRRAVLADDQALAGGRDRLHEAPRGVHPHRGRRGVEDGWH